MAWIRDIRVEQQQDYHDTSFLGATKTCIPGLATYTASIDLALSGPEEVDVLYNLIANHQEIDLAQFVQRPGWDGITLTSSPNAYTTTATTKEPTMSAHTAANDREREDLAQDIADHLKATLNPNRIWVDHDNVGPYGGKSSVVLVAAEEEGTKRVLGFAINVYCDDTTLNKVRDRVAEDEENKKVREELGWEE